MREREVLGPPRKAEPGGLAGEPQRDGNAAGGRGRGDREGLVAALRVVLACRDLDDKRALGHAETLVPRAGPGHANYGAARAHTGASPVQLSAMHGMLSAAILIGVLAVMDAACLYVAVRVYAAGGRRGDPS